MFILTFEHVQRKGRVTCIRKTAVGGKGRPNDTAKANWNILGGWKVSGELELRNIVDGLNERV